MSKKSKVLEKRLIQSKDTNSERVLGWIGRRLGYSLKKTESKIPSFVFEPEPVIRRPSLDYINLFEVATTSWPLRRAFRAIIQESTRNRWDKIPRFKYKCTKCEKEFKITPKDKKCTCGGELRTPDEEQGKLFDSLFSRMGKVNRDYRMDDLVRSSIFYDLSLDDWYWYIPRRRVPKMKDNKVVYDDNKQIVYEDEAREVYIEDTRFMFPITDDYGHLGGYEWYCNECYGKEQFRDKDLPVVPILPNMTAEQQEILKTCQYCDGPMTQTSYVEEVNGTVLARFSKEEIVHGSSSSVKPSLFGNTKIVSVFKIVQIAMAMDDYNWEVYNEGKVGALIGFPGEDQTEIDERKTNIEEELKRLDKHDAQTGRYVTSKKVRTLFMGVKKDQKPIRIPIMEDLKRMQSLEFYMLYLNAIGEVYGVTPEFVSTSTPGQGTKLKIEVQDRTTQEVQSNFADIFNSEVLPKFGITDWLFEFVTVAKKDELRDAQTLHTKLSTMMIASRISLNASIDENGNVRITGKAKLIEGEREGSRMGQTPRNMGGKPGRWQDGEPTRTQGERLELSDRTSLPISWYSVTQVRIKDKVFAVNSDMDEVCVVVNNTEVIGTRTSNKNMNYVIADLVDTILTYIKKAVPGKVEFEKLRKTTVTGLRRRFNSKLLIGIASYLDDKNLAILAEKIDSLRIRLEHLDFDTLQMFDTKGGMLETIPVKKGTVSEVPFGVEHKKESITKILNSILEWAKKEVKSGKKKEKIIHKAKIKAIERLDKHFEDLVFMGERHSQKSTGKKVGVSPEELKRLERWKSNSLEDFEVILRDTLRRRRKRNA